MDDQTKSLLGLAARRGLTIVGTYLAGRGIVQGEAGVSSFVGAGMVFVEAAYEAWNRYGMVLVNGQLAKLKGVHPSQVAAQSSVAPAAKVVIAALAVTGALMFEALWGFGSVHAAERSAMSAASQPSPLPCDPLHLFPGCKQADGSIFNGSSTAPSLLDTLLQQIYDKLHSDGEKIIADMNKAQSIAAATFSDGTVADEPSKECLAAVIPVAQLIVDNQLVPAGVTPAASGSVTGPATSATAGGTAATPDGIVTVFVKVRVVVNALQSPSLQKGCAWLQSSIGQTGTQGLANILAGLVGLSKLGVTAVAL
jgi:hypothetical protein